MDMFQILNNDVEGLSEEEREFAKKFNEDLREKIIDELAIHETNELIKDLKNDEEAFRLKMEYIFVNGKKGYKNMPTKALIDIYLDKKDEGEFVNLIESISN